MCVKEFFSVRKYLNNLISFGIKFAKNKSKKEKSIKQFHRLYVYKPSHHMKQLAMWSWNNINVRATADELYEYSEKKALDTYSIECCRCADCK